MNYCVKSGTLVGVLIFLLLAGCGQFSGDNPDLSIPTVSPGPTFSVDTRIVAKGVLVPADTALLAFTITGRVKNIMVDIGDEVQAGETLVQLETTVLEVDVAQAESGLVAAQAELDYEMRLNRPQELQTVADAKVKLAEADLARARYALTQANLTAPINGTVVNVQILPGEITTVGAVVVTLANLDTFQVETLNLNELDIPRVYSGQHVEIYIEALDIHVDGKVEKIIPKAFSFEEENVYKAIIRLNSQPRGMYWGMSVEVRLYPNE